MLEQYRQTCQKRMNVCKQQFKIFDISDHEILLSILNTFTKEDYRKWNNVNEAGYILLI